MDKKRRILLQRRLKQLQKERKQHQAELRRMRDSIRRLDSVIDQSEGLHQTNEGFKMAKMKAKKSSTLTADSASGIWIVKTKKDRDVELYLFKAVVKGEDPVQKLEVHLPNSGKMIGTEDGKEVTFNPGDIIRCHYEGDMDRGHTFRFQNVAALDETTKMQYEYALGKMGLGDQVELPEMYQIVDGIFRRFEL